MLNSEEESLTSPPVAKPRVISVVKIDVEINRAGSQRMAYSSAYRSKKSEHFGMHFPNIASVVAGQIRLTLATSYPFQPLSMISADNGIEYVRINAAVSMGSRSLLCSATQASSFPS